MDKAFMVVLVILAIMVIVELFSPSPGWGNFAPNSQPLNSCQMRSCN